MRHLLSRLAKCVKWISKILAKIQNSLKQNSGFCFTSASVARIHTIQEESQWRGWDWGNDQLVCVMLCSALVNCGTASSVVATAVRLRSSAQLSHSEWRSRRCQTAANASLASLTEKTGEETLTLHSEILRAKNTGKKKIDKTDKITKIPFYSV